MNTFLPYPSFSACAAVLDNKRLNKQIVEAYQMINGQWPNHPCSKMWANNIKELKFYFDCCLDSWKNSRKKQHKFEFYYLDHDGEYPKWINNTLIFLTHRVNLLRKDFEWYSQFNWEYEIQNLVTFPEGYFWPVGPLGKRAQEHSNNWLEWANKHKGEF